MTETRMYPGVGADERTTFAPYSAFDVPADLRELHGRYDVEAVARRVRNFRYAEEWIMMILGGWVATIPELPVKTGLGRIIWETAQAADRLGARLPELRCGTRSVSASEAPNEAFAAFVRSVAEPESPALTIEKLTGVFDVFLPHLADVWERTSAETDPIADAPTIKILEESLADARRHIAWGREVLDTLCAGAPEAEGRRRARRESLEAELRASGGVTGDLAPDGGSSAPEEPAAHRDHGVTGDPAPDGGRVPPPDARAEGIGRGRHGHERAEGMNMKGLKA